MRKGLTGNQVRAARTLADAFRHDEPERRVEIGPAGFAARVDSTRLRIAQESESEVICATVTSQGQI